MLREVMENKKAYNVNVKLSTKPKKDMISAPMPEKTVTDYSQTSIAPAAVGSLVWWYG